MESTARPPVSVSHAVAVDSTGVLASGVSWSAVLAGAVAAAALSLILAFLGFGFGMAAISPWAGVGVSAATLGVASIVWITLTQIAASSLGGYLAGRLRVRWASVHRDEVYFRDTAHGFLAWGVATLAVGALFASTLGSIAKTGAELSANVASDAVSTAVAVAGGGKNAGLTNLDYTVDSLFRSAPATPAVDGGATPAGPETTPEQRAEVARILAQGVSAGSMVDADIRYLGQLIAQRSGRSTDEAEAMVRRAQAELHKAVTATKEAADKARKAASYTALWLFISLLGGAFFAALSATFGGRRRDLDL